MSTEALAVAATQVAQVVQATDASATCLRDLVAAGSLSAEDLLVEHLVRIAEREPAIRSLVQVDRAGALRAARRVDVRRRRGGPGGLLAGVPVVVKDNIDVRGQATAACSLACPEEPATRDAEVVRRLRRAGAVLVGRANMDEMAMGASTQTSVHGPSRNPHDHRRSPGGSSGGCATAVAAFEVPLAVGTDTGGSVREPAAQCGVVGMAPSPGLVPLSGVMPFAPGLDRVGPLAREVADLALLLAVMADRPVLAAAGRSVTVPDLRGLRVGVVEELTGAGNRAEVLDLFRDVLALVTALGAQVLPLSLPSARTALATYMSVSSAACVPFVAEQVATGRAGPEVRRRFELGLRLRGEGEDELAAAWTAQRRLRTAATAALAGCDLLLCPTMPSTAPLLDLGPSPADLADPLSAPYTDCWTVVANLAGLPSLSLPSGRSAVGRMPVGTMLTGRPGSDALLLRVAAALEAAGADS